MIYFVLLVFSQIFMILSVREWCIYYNKIDVVDTLHILFDGHAVFRLFLLPEAENDLRTLRNSDKKAGI